MLAQLAALALVVHASTTSFPGPLHLWSMLAQLAALDLLEHASPASCPGPIGAC